MSIRHASIKQVKVADLVPATYHPREISENALEGLRASLTRFGMVEPIIWNERTGTVVGGHQRLKVLAAAGATTTKVAVVDLREAEEKALSLALNNPATMGRFTSEVIPLLEEIEFDLPDLYSELRLNDLLALVGDEVRPAGPAADPGPRLDQADELQAKWKVKSGQLWALGKHRVLCGDSTDPAAVTRVVGRKPVVMAFTDPPYNVSYGESKNPAHGTRSIKNDSLDAAGWERFVKTFGARLKESVSGDLYIWGASGPDGMRMRLWMIELGLHWSATIVWTKQHFVLSPAKYQRKYEPCLYGWFGEKSSYRGNRKQTDVWAVDRPVKSPEHPTMKPVELVEMGVLNSSKPGDTVLDLFLGSGTTLIACERQNRRCRAIEFEPKYVAVTLERWQELAGQRPKLAK